MPTRPSPSAAATPPQAVQQTRLRPVYSALDNRNFAKVLKLTTVEPSCHWPLTKALRIIALDRSGRKREALGLLRDVLGPGCYHELEDRILQMDVGLLVVAESASSSSAAATGGGGGKSRGGKKGKGKKSHAAAPTKPDTSNVAPAPAPIDYIDLIDVPPWKRRMQRKQKALADGTNHKANVFTDDVVLATLKVTLLSQRLNETLAQLYSLATDALSSRPIANKEELCSILQDSYFSQIRLACTYPRIAHVVDDATVSEKNVWEAEQIAAAYECAQLSAMSLARHTGSRLHHSWVASAALLQKEANADAIKLMEARLSTVSSDEEESSSTCIRDRLDKLKAKNAMLPRLAESLMSRVVSREGDDESKDHPPSAEDWNLYIRALVEQDKYSDAIEKLEGVKCASRGSSDSTKGELRRIDDEMDVASHDGSLIQLAHRSRLEQKASLCLKVERYEEASEMYTELLSMLPDNWSYWIGFLQSTVGSDTDERQVENCIVQCRKHVEPYVPAGALTYPLRGPHLFHVELAAIPLRGIESTNKDEPSSNDLSKFLQKEVSVRESLVRNLGEAVIDYATVFSPKASCCFYDLRNYLELFATACYELKEEATTWEELLKVLRWAENLREGNRFEQDIKDAKERRKRLRSYIFSVQMAFGVLHTIRSCDEKNDASSSESLDAFFPSLGDMVDEWHTSLDLGSNPKDGGQKEVLPGDELILLACQRLGASSNSNAFDTSLSITEAALLEGSLYHSPYNPHLKIAAVEVYTRLSAGQRALELFDDMGVKQIQYDSCSYLIFPTLIRTGFYREAVQLAGNVMGLHWTSAKDVQDYAIKCCETGMLSKCCEMITWQRERMTSSLQLLISKSTVMDLAPLVSSGEPDERGKHGSVEPLAARQGIIGGDDDFDRVGEMIKNIGNFSAAPSIVNVALDGSTPNENLYSDNRDFTVNQFHILSEVHHATKRDVCWYALLQSHWQGILMRAALMLNVVKAPKKGKVAKVREGDTLYKRCESLFQFLDITDNVIDSARTELSDCRTKDEYEYEYAPGRVIINLARVLCAVTGMHHSSGDEEEDTLAVREKRAVMLLQVVQDDINTIKQAVSSSAPGSSRRVCVLLPEAVVPIYALVEMNSVLFAIFGWGKKRSRTRVAAGALAEAAQQLQDLVTDMSSALAFIPDNVPSGVSPGNICSYLESEEGKTMLEAVVKHVDTAHLETRQRVMPFLDQMITNLRTYSEEMP